MLDLVLCLVALPVAAVMFLVIAPLIYLEDRGSVFYNSQRVGRDGKLFCMYKYRSMRPGAPDIVASDGSTYNAADDGRLTRIGAFLRRSSLDEVPQVLNILVGQMSFIGPRPDLPREAALYEGSESIKLWVRPGISGYTQVFGRNALPWRQRLALDVTYVQRQSFLLDIRIFFRTFFVVLSQKGVYVSDTQTPAGADTGKATSDTAANADTGPGSDGKTDGDIPLKNPSITVLVPIYNAERYLERCLDSIAAQSFTNFEVLCINDGSADGSRAIVNRYQAADARFTLLDKLNSGYGDSMNQGLALARGEYLAIVEADDFIALDMLERLWRVATSTGAEVAKANCYRYWGGAHPHRRRLQLVPRHQSGRIVDPHQHTEIFHLTQSIWSALYQRRFLADNQIDFVPSQGAAYQDTGFNFKVWASSRRVIFISQALYYYRQDNAASSVASVGKERAVVDEYVSIQTYLNERPQLASLKPLAQKLKFDAYLWNYERLAPDLKLDFLRFFAAEICDDLVCGCVCRDYYETWKLYDLDLIAADAHRYHKLRLRNGGATKYGRLRFYLLEAGPLVCARFIWSKLYRGGKGKAK
jgi:lipopolysaccharide/colanic/teichoic acid biosynthesis glycosyltransferase/glycosyltransferase involved in cell wall biosynthesis